MLWTSINSGHRALVEQPLRHAQLHGPCHASPECEVTPSRWILRPRGVIAHDAGRPTVEETPQVLGIWSVNTNNLQVRRLSLERLETT